MSKANVENPTEQPVDERQSLTFFQMVCSILASFFGVQTTKNRDRDFALGKARAFIMVGVLMTAVWYGAIALVVHFVLEP